MLQIYRRFWQVNWAEQWQYRANLLMYLLYWLVSPVVYLAVWITIANSQGSVNGLTANDFVTYYLTLLIVDQLTSEITIHILAYKIQDGTLSGDLLRPVHPILTSTLVNNLAFKALTFMALHPDLDRAVPALPPRLQRGHARLAAAGRPGDPARLLPSTSCSARPSPAWPSGPRGSIRSREFYLRRWSSSSPGSSSRSQLMPPVIQNVAQFLPFQMFRYFPIEIILNRLPPDVILRDYAVGPGLAGDLAISSSAGSGAKGSSASRRWEPERMHILTPALRFLQSQPADGPGLPGRYGGQHPARTCCGWAGSCSA